MVDSTQTAYNEPYSNTGTRPIREQNFLQQNVYSDDQSRTLFLSYQDVTNPTTTWQDTLAAREEALRNRHMKTAERWMEHTRRFPPLTVGDHVRIQNQVGPHPTKWDKTGLVIEVRQFDQYVIRVDGSGRATTRNRKFLRKFVPVQPTPPRRTIYEDLRHMPTPQRKSHIPLTAAPNNNPTLLPTVPQNNTDVEPVPTIPDVPNIITPEPTTTSSPPKKPSLALRRLMDFNKKGLTED